jgi:hypothetical protein
MKDPHIRIEADQLNPQEQCPVSTTLAARVNYVGGLPLPLPPAMAGGRRQRKLSLPPGNRADLAWVLPVGSRRQSRWPVPLLSLRSTVGGGAHEPADPIVRRQRGAPHRPAPPGIWASWRDIDAWSGRRISPWLVLLNAVPVYGGSSRR